MGALLCALSVETRHASTAGYRALQFLVALSQPSSLLQAHQPCRSAAVCLTGIYVSCPPPNSPVCWAVSHLCIQHRAQPGGT